MNSTCTERRCSPSCAASSGLSQDITLVRQLANRLRTRKTW